MEMMSERGIYVVSDECYLRFVYPPGEVFSAASFPPNCDPVCALPDRSRKLTR